MDNKKRRIYSRRGDLGETSLCFGPRVGKDHKRIVACGELDELNCRIGLVRVEKLAAGMAEELETIQSKIFELSAEVASFTPEKHRITTIKPDDILQLEKRIDAWSSDLPPLNHFLMPGGCCSAALLQLARSACRSAERAVVALVRSDESVSRLSIGWLNRLSDLLFTLSRVENREHGISE